MDLTSPSTVARLLVEQLGTSSESLLEFIAIYARLEHALKRVGRVVERNGRLDVRWEGLVRAVESHFCPAANSPLHRAVVYIAEHPPKKQVLREGEITWTEIPPDRADLSLTKLLEHIRRIRNNLFHGGKYATTPIPDPARNQRLLQSATLVLCEIVRLSLEYDEPVFHAFTEHFE
jgi:hypothetical protein